MATRTDGTALARALAGAALCVLPACGGVRAAPSARPPPEAPAAASDAEPVRAVGKLNVITGPASRQFCTATLIGPRLVLTAAHCLYIRARDRWVEPEAVHFVAGYAQGAYTAHALARAYTKPDAYRFGEDRATLARDWALVELRADIPIRPLPISRATGPEAGPATFTGILHAGYKASSHQIVSVERGCAAQSSGGDLPLLGHSCLIAHGESGSALIVAEDGGPAILGVLVATLGSGGSRNGGSGGAATEGAAPASLAVPASAFRAAAEAALARQAGAAPP